MTPTRAIFILFAIVGLCLALYSCGCVETVFRELESHPSNHNPATRRVDGFDA